MDLANLDIPIPSLDQQRGIASFLDRETGRLDALLAEKEGLLELLARKRRALITRAVSRGLDPAVPLANSGLPWLGKIPEHWSTMRAKYLFRQSSLPVSEGDEMVTCFRDGQVTLRRNRREEGFTNAEKELGYQGIRAGQLVLHSMDAFAGAIGVSDSAGKCSPEYIICDPVCDEVVNEYYGQLLRVMALNGFIQAMCPAVRERAPRIRFSDFGEMFLPVLPVPEQRAIMAWIQRETGKLDALRVAAERTTGLLRERRAALIAAAVTGQLAVGS
jgi:type I restriction enzyme S subunit